MDGRGRARTHAGDDLAKVIRYYRAHWEALFRFVDQPEIPIDNSATEREHQNIAKLRRERRSEWRWSCCCSGA